VGSSSKGTWGSLIFSYQIINLFLSDYRKIFSYQIINLTNKTRGQLFEGQLGLPGFFTGNEPFMDAPDYRPGDNPGANG